MYRPQFAFPPAPEGFVWQRTQFSFDASNVPALASLTLSPGQESGYIVLRLDRDACFVLLGVKITPGGVDVLLFDPWLNPLMDDFVDPAQYASEDIPTQLEPGVYAPANSQFSIRLRGR